MWRVEASGPNGGTAEEVADEAAAKAAQQRSLDQGLAVLLDPRPGTPRVPRRGFVGQC
jgi:hypothetical protein